jgi:thioredoxin reductase (NADPH)
MNLEFNQVNHLASEAFPTLNDEQLSAVAQLSELVEFETNQSLIQQGQKGYPFYVIRSGSVRIVELCEDKETLIVNHGPREFTGDVDMLTGRSAVISAIANEPVVAYQLCAQRLRKLLNDCPSVSDTLLDAFQIRRRLLAASDFVGVKIVGEANAAETSRLREFFYKNHVPYTFYASSSDYGREQLTRIDSAEVGLPIVQCNGHTVVNPSLPKLAECIGISRNVDGKVFDLIIVGAGPAGLAAAVYATSEGINTLVIDSVGPGGQAGSSSKIENFIGFPSGISGGELANRGYLQALKFGAQFIAPITVRSIETQPNGEHHLHLCTGQVARAVCVLVASGVTYRQLGVEGCTSYEGAGLYYAATSAEARVCEDSTAVIVGGGNSAGQAAMYLANTSREVKVLIRGDDLSKSMSSYLCDRVLNHPKIQVIKNSAVTAIHGDRCVEAITYQDHLTNASTRISCSGLFCFIGAQPHTAWLPSGVLLDDKGYIRTGSAIPSNQVGNYWKLDRHPCDLETTVPGILAAGDVRSGSTKRCGFAVGDGSMAVTCVHRYFATIRS